MSGPQKGRSLILLTVRNITDRTNATLICPSVVVMKGVLGEIFRLSHVLRY